MRGLWEKIRRTKYKQARTTPEQNYETSTIKPRTVYAILNLNADEHTLVQLIDRSRSYERLKSKRKSAGREKQTNED